MNVPISENRLHSFTLTKLRQFVAGQGVFDRFGIHESALTVFMIRGNTKLAAWKFKQTGLMHRNRVSVQGKHQKFYESVAVGLSEAFSSK
jgi:hypothetical protein